MSARRGAIMRAIRAVLATVCAVTTVIGAVAAPGQAANVGPDTVKLAASAPAGATASVWDPATGTSARVSTAEAQRVVDAYWTRERMAAARPLRHVCGVMMRCSVRKSSLSSVRRPATWPGTATRHHRVPATCRAAPGEMPTTRLNARLNAASD